MSIITNDEMRLRALAVKVEEMRAKQREFFDRSRRTATTMREAKALEARVDAMVESILDRQPKLF